MGARNVGVTAASINRALAGQTLTPGSVTLDSAGTLGWSTDLFLRREAANTLAQRNGVNAQTFRLYNTFTDASNYERASLYWSANKFILDITALGTGTTRDFGIIGGGTSLDVLANGINMFRNGTSNSTLLTLSGTSLTSTAQNFVRFAPTINQASGAYEVIDINPTETAIGAGPHYLIGGRLGAGAIASTFGIDRLGAFRSSLGSALTAGGTTNYGYFMSSSNIGVICGSGAPTVSAPKGTLYLRSDGSTTITRIYVNTDGSTTWTYLTAGA